MRIYLLKIQLPLLPRVFRNNYVASRDSFLALWSHPRLFTHVAFYLAIKLSIKAQFNVNTLFRINKMSLFTIILRLFYVNTDQNTNPVQAKFKIWIHSDGYFINKFTCAYLSFQIKCSFSPLHTIYNLADIQQQSKYSDEVGGDLITSAGNLYRKVS